ncbi:MULTISPECIES: DUF961 family protein [unclassified Enterococcus]|uniref:DUF961 family protein n=1 Tax=unclassified Enterococcus TaxID=2608891 RepID=UPI001908A2BD|nr:MULTISPECIES: DUF961 family protein [unclassified Enterococcus]MBK0036038.1 DUF961 family protein [Enterococcus sp. S52]MBK0068696.1 DUF961 family protein [Enterococcus sp. S53]MBK0139289.1 DUF961 family protein [Enterococcus sp. S76]MBK0142924.1 DUF961 family protein [Enterococcus sp. S77]
MPVKFLVPENEMFGRLEFGSYNEDKNVIEFRGRQREVTHRCFSVFSDKLGGIDVFVDATVGNKVFDYEAPVELINPRLFIGGGVIQGNNQGRNQQTYSEWTVYAEDIKKVGA